MLIASSLELMMNSLIGWSGRHWASLPVLMLLVSITMAATSLNRKGCSFHHVPNHSLNGHNDYKVQWISEEHCLSLCIERRDFRCLSFEKWIRQPPFCVLSRASKSSHPESFQANSLVDYYHIECREENTLDNVPSGGGGGCELVNCLNGGSCFLSATNEVSCRCVKGFFGPRCEHADPCQFCIHGSCQKDLHQVLCLCYAGFEGKDCGEDINECEVSNGGCSDLCVNTIGNFFCSCANPTFHISRDNRTCEETRAQVLCSPHSMTIILERQQIPALTISRLTLRNPRCKATANGTHIRLETHYGDCGTSAEVSENSISYHNEVLLEPLDAEEHIQRHLSVHIPFQCNMDKMIHVSGKYDIHSKPINFSALGKGAFRVRMKFFADVRFQAELGQDGPIEVSLNSMLYVLIELESAVEQLGILTHECKATPDQDKNSVIRYYIIQENCPSDPTVLFLPTESISRQKFQFSAFKFAYTAGQVFLHCEVMLCTTKETCDPLCPQTSWLSSKDYSAPVRREVNITESLIGGPIILIGSDLDSIRGKTRSNAALVSSWSVKCMLASVASIFVLR